MVTVTELELEQKTSEYIQYLKDYAVKTNRDLVYNGKHDGFRLSILDKDITLEFTV